MQAQTVANFLLSFEANLSIVPVINKVSQLLPHTTGLCANFPSPQIDLPLANTERVMEQLHNVFGFNPKEAIQVYSGTSLIQAPLG